MMKTNLSPEEKETRLRWLKNKRREKCPHCQPRIFPYSLVRTTNWCPECDRVWKYIYLNPQDAIKKARRMWWFEDYPKEVFKV